MPFHGGANSSFFSGMRPGAITNPNVLPSLQVWYDASDSAQFVPSNPSDGDTFTQWTDKSAFAHNANPNGGAAVRATYQASEQNSLSVVRFDGVNDNLTINPATWAANLSGFSVFVVARIANTTGVRTIISSDQNGQKIFWNGTNWAVKDSGATGTSTATADTTKFHTFGLVYDGTKTSNADRLLFRYAETTQSLSFTGTVGSTTSPATSVLDIGWYNNSEYFAGDIGEIIYFSRAVTTAEIAGIESYLSLKWAV